MVCRSTLGPIASSPDSRVWWTFTSRTENGEDGRTSNPLGTDRPITDNPDADPWAYAMQSAISPDARQVAFARRTRDGATRALRLVSVAGNAPPPSRLLHNDPNTSEIRPHA
jgi:hypothetical protein